MKKPQKKLLQSFVIAGEKSGVGKTMITLALARALMHRGYVVQCFKVGPDFIDPTYHTAVTGRLSRNLDPWMTSEAYCRTLFLNATYDADIAVVEGVMGLFDGYGKQGAGSTAMVARFLELPVILIVDAESRAQTAAAVVLGCRHYDVRLRIRGVIFNKVASENHYKTLRDAVTQKTDIAVLGYIPRGSHWHTPHRHLGLVMAAERDNLSAVVDRCAEQIEQTIALSRILKDRQPVPTTLKIKQPAAISPRQSSSRRKTPLSKPCIGVARDEAFCFCYQDNIELLERCGADIIYFSPLRDPKLPAGIQGLYLPGGYPELYAAKLSENRTLKKQVLAFCRSGKPVYAECGGFLYLLQRLVDHKGRVHAMVGFFPAKAYLREQLQRFGYITVTATAGCPFLPEGQTMRGHEFHYSDISPMPASITRTFSVSRRSVVQPSAEGYTCGAVLAGYPHLHFGSNPAFAEHFVAACTKIMVEEQKRTEMKKIRSQESENRNQEIKGKSTEC